MKKAIAICALLIAGPASAQQAAPTAAVAIPSNIADELRKLPHPKIGVMPWGMGELAHDLGFVRSADERCHVFERRRGSACMLEGVEHVSGPELRPEPFEGVRTRDEIEAHRASDREHRPTLSGLSRKGDLERA